MAGTASFCTPLDPLRDIRRAHKALPKRAYLYLLGLGLVVAVILLPLSIKKLESTDYGVEYDTVASKVGGVDGEGLHVGPVGFAYVKFPAVFRTEQLNATCISKDGLFVDVAVSFQFAANHTQLKTIISKYRDYNKFRQIVRSAAAAAVHDGCSQYLMEEFQSLRSAIQATQFAELNVQHKEKAQADIDLAQNERQQQLIIASTNLNVTQGIAQITLANATTNAAITLLQANATAQVVLNSLLVEADTLAGVKKSLGLTVPGLLAYLANRALEAKTQLNLAIAEPAHFSYMDALV